MANLNIIVEPCVRVLTRQVIDQSALTDFLVSEADAANWTTDAKTNADAIPEIAGRLCYLSFKSPRPGGNAAYLQHILESGHGSVLEHTVFGLLITGVSRSLTHEVIRHRAGTGFSELSQRYVDCADVAFVVPPAMLRYCDDYRQHLASQYDSSLRLAHPFGKWLDRRDDDLDEYEEWTTRLTADAPAELSGTDRRKWARQAARSVLPNCTETKMVMTGNVRAWRNVIEQRGSRHADMEIRRLAFHIWQRLQGEAPGLFGDYSWSSLPDGTWEVSTPWRKV